MTNIDKYILLLFSEQPIKLTTLKNILLGRRTSSNLFLALIHKNLRLLKIFMTLPYCDLNLFKQRVILLKNNDYLKKTSSGYYFLSKKGIYYKNIFSKKIPLPLHYDGKWMTNFMFMKKTIILCVQVISNFLNNNNNYIPQIQDLKVQLNFKNKLKKASLINNWQYIFINELKYIFNKLPLKYSNLLANRFSGYNVNGIPIMQLSSLLSLSKEETYFMEIDAWSYFFEIYKLYRSKFRIISLFLPQINYLSPNVQDTVNQILKLHLSLGEICYRKKIKESTVYDHILKAEIIQPFLFKNVYFNSVYNRQKLQNEWNNNKLLNYNNLLNNGLSFFQIRFFHIKRIYDEFYKY